MRNLISFMLLAACLVFARSSVAQDSISGIPVTFHPWVKSWLETLQSQNPPEFLAKSVTPCLIISGSERQTKSCSLKQAEASHAYCLKVLDPIGEMLNLPVKERYDYATDDIESLVDMSGSLFAHFGIKGDWKPWQPKAEAIIRKIKYQTFSDGLRNQKRCLSTQSLAAVERTLSDIASGPQMNLPYPYLTSEDRRLTSMALGAVLWRVRGGGAYGNRMPMLSLPQYERRKFLRDPIAAISRLSGGDNYIWIGNSVLFQFFFKGYSQFFDMGHLPKHKKDCGTKQEDFENMSRRGVYFVTNAVKDLAAQGFNTKPLEFAGRQIGACYLHAWDVKHANGIKWQAAKPIPEVFDVDIASGPLTWGELCFGAGLGLGISETLLAGKTLGPHAVTLDNETIEHPCP